MKVSVIINSYKGTEPYLPECIESVMAQTTPPYEVILVMDGYTRPMVYPGTTTVIRDNNIGVAQSRHEGVKISTGDWLLFVDADDVLAENYIEEMMAQVRWNKAEIIYPQCVLWSRWGEDKTLLNGYFTPPYDLRLADMAKQNYVVVTSLMKRKVYDKIGGFNPDLILFEDYEFFLKAFVRGFKFARANCFLKYRQRTQSRNRANSSEKSRIYEKIRDEVLKDIDVKAFDKKLRQNKGRLTS